MKQSCNGSWRSSLERERVRIRVENIAEVFAAHAENAANLIRAVPSIQQAGRGDLC